MDIFDTPMLKKGAYGCFGERELGAGDSNPELILPEKVCIRVIP